MLLGSNENIPCHRNKQTIKLLLQEEPVRLNLSGLSLSGLGEGALCPLYETFMQNVSGGLADSETFHKIYLRS